MLHWGNAKAAGESNGKAVFNASNGYLSVWHMNESVKDEVGTLQSKDVDTTASAGIIGAGPAFCRRAGDFRRRQDSELSISASPHSTEAWFRAERSTPLSLAGAMKAAAAEQGADAISQPAAPAYRQ